MKAARNSDRCENRLQRAQTLEGLPLRAADGEIGTLQALCLDDARWVVRYLLVDCAGWIEGRKVLVPPLALGESRAGESSLCVELTRGQIKDSPPIDPERPVSRAYEIRYYRYYDWPAYWEFDPLAGLSLPQIPASPRLVNGDAADSRQQVRHLFPGSELRGCEVVARDGSIGTIRDLVVDTRYWLIRYMEIKTGSGWPVRYVILSHDWIKCVHWIERRVFVDLASAAIARAPRFDPTKGISHEYEAQLLEHYGNPVSC